MESTSRTIVLVPIQTVITDVDTTEMVLPGRFTGVRVRFVTGAATGTSPTLNCYVQNGIRTAAAADIAQQDATGAIEWNDFISFAQATGAQTQYAGVVASGNFVAAAQDRALSVSTARNGPLGDRWRVRLDVGGTNPSFVTVSVVAEFLS